MSEFGTRDEWLAYGIAKGFCSPSYCDTHEGGPLAELEQEQFDRGDDPCVIAIRLGNETEWSEDAQAFEDNWHSPYTKKEME